MANEIKLAPAPERKAFWLNISAGIIVAMLLATVNYFTQFTKSIMQPAYVVLILAALLILSLSMYKNVSNTKQK